MHPILVTFDGFALPSYGVVYLTAFLGAIAIFAALASRNGQLSFWQFVDLGFQISIAGEIGARLLFVITEWSHVISGAYSPGRFLVAGRVVLGGIVAGTCFGAWVFRRHRLRAWPTLDALMVAAAFGMAVGRIGCLLAGCCFGAPTNAPWGITFTDPVANRISGTPLHVPLHPTQPLQMVLDGTVFALLLWRILRPHVQGEVTALFLVGVGTARLIGELFRGDERGEMLGIATSQWISRARVVAGIAILLGRRRAAGPSRAAAARA